MSSNLLIMLSRQKKLLNCSKVFTITKQTRNSTNKHKKYLYKNSSGMKPTKVYMDPSLEYSETPEYPPIEARVTDREMRHREWYKKIDGLPTVEQKLYEVNIPKMYGWLSVNIKAEKPVINGADFAQICTRTRIIDGSPDQYYETTTKAVEEMLPSIKSKVDDLISLHFGSPIQTFSVQRRNRRDGFAFVQDLNLMLLSQMGLVNLLDVTVDTQPRISSFNFVSVFEADKLNKHLRRRCRWSDDEIEKPMERGVVLTYNPDINVRSPTSFLPEVASLDDPICTEGDIPNFTPDHRSYGHDIYCSRARVFPGFWPTEEDSHSQLSISLLKPVIDFEKKYGPEYSDMAMQQLFMYAGHCQTLARAAYLGFGFWRELEYPLVQQLCGTDGRRWRFGLYQLNTVDMKEFRNDAKEKNPLNNVLWLAPEMKLYETIEDGKVRGLNEDVIKVLLHNYLKEGAVDLPVAQLGSEKVVGNFDACEEYRTDFHHYYRRDLAKFAANKPEIYAWERIFKLQHNIRRMEARKRFFEKFEYPHKRPMNDFNRYIKKRDRKVRRISRKPALDSENLYKYSDKLKIKFRMDGDYKYGITS